MSVRLKQILSRLSSAEHRGGTFSSEVLLAISNLLPDAPFLSLETGCGKSTVVFSNLASQHYVFTYDDRNVLDSSVTMVQSDPDFRPDTTTFIYGPTQLTLPRFVFPVGQMFDVILIDGPHGYPFPDLEYAMLYNRLKPGGILIIDDLHIPSIGAMYDLLREDRMYDEIGVISTTGLLRRSHLSGIPSDGDHWYEQNYNVSRFPLSMAKYQHPCTVITGEVQNLSNRKVLERFSQKGFEVAPDGSGALTTDLSATLEMDIGGNGGSLILELTYRSLYPDAASEATIICGGQSYLMPLHPVMTTAEFRFDVPTGSRVKLTLMQPNAISEHDRETKRYDFRRLGILVKSLRLISRDESDGSSRPIPAPHKNASATVPHADEIVRVLSVYASDYPYSTGVDDGMIDTRFDENSTINSDSEFRKLIGRRAKVHYGEFLAFDGDRFAEAVAWAICGRSASIEQRERFALNNDAVNRITFLLAVDHQNRIDKGMTKLQGLKFGRILWRMKLTFHRYGMEPAAELIAAILRRYCRKKVYSLLLETSQRRLMFAVLDKLS